MNAVRKIEAATSLEAALATALPLLEGAKKSANNPHFKTKYADLGAVIEAIRPIAEHGIWYRQVLHEGADGVTVETLYTGFGETISAGSLFMPAAKRDAQGFGSALTYARRYALVTAFGLSTEDDDGNAASAPRQQARREEMPDHEWSRLVQLVEATSANIPAMLKHLSIVVADNNLKLLNQDDYARVLDALNSKLAKMAKEQTAAKASNFGKELADEIVF